MTISDFATERRRILEQRLNSEISWRDGTVAGVPDWFSTLLTDLVLAVGDEDIRYLSAKFTPTTADTAGSMAIIVFTDVLVAYAYLDPDPALESRTFEVVVTARKQLRSFQIDTLPGFDPGAESTDGLQISVMYPDFSRTLPLGESDWPQRGDDTRELLQCLRADLVN